MCFAVGYLESFQTPTSDILKSCLRKNKNKKRTSPKFYRNSNQKLRKGWQLRNESIKKKGIMCSGSSAQRSLLSFSLFFPYALRSLNRKPRENPCGMLLFRLSSLTLFRPLFCWTLRCFLFLFHLCMVLVVLFRHCCSHRGVACSVISLGRSPHSFM